MAGPFLRACGGLVFLALVVALLLFVPAGLGWTEGLVFFALFFGMSFAITLYLAKADPALLARRTEAGPTAETAPRQKQIQAFSSLAFMLLLLVPALDHRFRWPPDVPRVLVFAGDAMVLAGFAIVFVVFRANTFTSAVIEVAQEQRVVDTGPYAIVRHPMYVGGLVLTAGTPLALGSLVGFVPFALLATAIVLRLLDEERYLSANLRGYDAYRAKVKYRLVPYVF